VTARTFLHTLPSPSSALAGGDAHCAERTTGVVLAQRWIFTLCSGTNVNQHHSIYSPASRHPCTPPPPSGMRSLAIHFNPGPHYRPHRPPAITRYRKTVVVRPPFPSTGPLEEFCGCRLTLRRAGGRDAVSLNNRCCERYGQVAAPAFLLGSHALHLKLCAFTRRWIRTGRLSNAGLRDHTGRWTRVCVWDPVHDLCDFNTAVTTAFRLWLTPA